MPKKYAIIGTGPTGSGVLKGFAKHRAKLAGSEIHIFDRAKILGVGTPYDSEMNDLEHLLNVMTLSTSIPEEGKKFFEWIKNNAAAIKEQFHEIIDARLTEKLQECGDDEAKKTTHIEQYQKIWNSIETRYLNMENGMSYHPRILYGIYCSCLFAGYVQALEQAGATVVLHNNSETTSLDRQNNLEFTENGKKKKIEGFDEIIIATGHWHQSEFSNDNYISHVYPSTAMNKKLQEIIAAEIKRGNKDIHFAIEGSSLSAIDAIKSIYHDGVFERENNKLIFKPNDLDGVQIHVDMISRSGQFQAVKGDFLRGEKTNAKYPRITERDLENLAAESGGKFCLWQLMKITCKKIRAAYLDHGTDEDNAVRIPQLDEFISLLARDGKKLPEKTNYTQILEALSELESRGIHDPFQKLQQNLKEAESGDNKDGNSDLIWQIIYKPIDDLLISPYLPTEEKIMRFKILDRMHRIHAESMPPETAHELLALGDAGLLRMVSLDIRNKQIDENGHINFGGDKSYAAVIDTTGHAFNVEKNPSPLFQSMVQNGMIFSTKEKFCSAAEYDEKMADLENRFSKKFMDRFKASLPKPNDDSDCFYDRGILNMNNNNDRQAVGQNGELTCPGVRFLLQTGGIAASDKKGLALADKLLGIEATSSIFKASAQPVENYAKANYL